MQVDGVGVVKVIVVFILSDIDVLTSFPFLSYHFQYIFFFLYNSIFIN